jgi:hypothetical protein
VSKVGFRTPNIGLRRGRFGRLRKAVPSLFSASQCRGLASFLNRWGYGGGQCRVHRILGPLANNPAETLVRRGWVAGHRSDVEFASLIHPS